jgi:hypothetical protein
VHLVGVADRGYGAAAASIDTSVGVVGAIAVVSALALSIHADRRVGYVYASKVICALAFARIGVALEILGARIFGAGLIAGSFAAAR